jgi:hypothetical protein
MFEVGVHLPAQNIESEQPIKLVFATTGDQATRQISTFTMIHQAGHSLYVAQGF